MGLAVIRQQSTLQVAYDHPFLPHEPNPPHLTEGRPPCRAVGGTVAAPPAADQAGPSQQERGTN
ncbi:MAG TPA: hypothetical protein VLQ80_11755 [Candidatus Saccharimonadia bacterium]|nr:hypothetical protein [Candidatus Saccharimonadia bacterium]